MINNENLNSIIKDCELAGYTIKVKDISYILLCRIYDDIAVAYKVIFNNDKSNADIIEYHKSNAIAFLRDYMDSNYKDGKSDAPEIAKPKRKKNKGEDITFDENKEAIIKMIKEVEEKEASGELDANQSAQLRTKLRIALNDKFQVKEEFKEQMVIVNCKFNDVCDCGREIYVPTKEDLMQKYNLIENKQ